MICDARGKELKIGDLFTSQITPGIRYAVHHITPGGTVGAVLVDPRPGEESGKVFFRAGVVVKEPVS